MQWILINSRELPGIQVDLDIQENSTEFYRIKDNYSKFDWIQKNSIEFKEIKKMR